ncbi:MAG: LptF/LptG family permease [bacterium]
MLKIIDRQLLKLWIIPTVASFIICVFLFLVGDIFGLTDDLLQQTPAFSTILTYYFYRMAHISYFLVAMALILGGFWGLSGWRQTNQWPATLASGRHPVYILRVPLILLLILTIFSIYYTIFLLPGITDKATFMRDVKMKGGKIQKPSYRDLHFRLPEGGTIKIGRFNPEKGIIHDVGIDFLENGQFSRRWEAPRGKYDSASGWKLINPTVRKFTSGMEHTTENKDEIIFAFEPPGLLKKIINSDPRQIDKKPEQFTLAELEQVMNFRQKRGMNIDAERVFWHWKFSFPLSNLVLGIIGLLLGIRREISRAGGVGYCLLLGFAYWAIFNSSIAFGQSGSLRFLVGDLSPLLFTYGPLFLYSGLIYYLWQKIM